MEDKRKFERTKLPPMEMIVNWLKDGSGVYHGLGIILEDISEEGMRFTTGIELTVGDVIYFELPDLLDYERVQGRVAWTAALENGNYRYGLQILSEPEQENEY